MHPFKRGFERIIEGLNVPVVPVHLDGLWGSVFSFKDGRFFLKWPQTIPYPVTLSFGDPLPTRASADHVRRAVMELARRAWEYRRGPRENLASRFLESV
jgi:acyl-[acyl-carrier-protein]-phospholipid O-acyltransferase/long-chain-fatty-acid--[acyl-carrier-protein] ligase